VDPHGRDEVRQQPDPVPVATVEPKPEDAEAGPAREVGEQGRLPIARFGDQQDGAAMDLDREPFEQAVTRQRLLAEWRRLDLADLDRVLGHAEVPSG